jgi:hypothetical protein
MGILKGGELVSWVVGRVVSGMVVERGFEPGRKIDHGGSTLYVY